MLLALPAEKDNDDIIRQHAKQVATIREVDLADFEDAKNRIRVQQYVDPRVVVFHVGHHQSNMGDTAGFLLQRGDV